MPPPTHSADLVLPLRADLAEGPLWHPRRQRIYFVDIMVGRIHEYDPPSGRRRAIEAGAKVGCLAPRADGHLVATVDSGLAAVDLDTGQIATLVTPPEHDAHRCRFNDGKCDPQGRLWAGTMGLEAEPGAGSLYCFPSATESRRVLPNVSVSNGLAWSLDGETLYYIDSPTGRVDAFDFEGETGRIARRRPAFTLPPDSGIPDGCALDAEGMLWVAHWGGGRVTRWNPQTGAHLATILLPAPHVTSCTFGGPRLETLYITTARRGLDPVALAAFPESGGIFACQTGSTGLPASVFRG